MGKGLKPFALLISAIALAPAVIFFLLNYTDASRRCSEAGVPKASATIKAANIALSKGEFEIADGLAGTVIHEIGERYIDPAALDDTGLKLSLADAQRSRGNIQASAKIRVSMAQNRLTSLQHLARCRVSH
jgi:hypothetical protein